MYARPFTGGDTQVSRLLLLITRIPVAPIKYRLRMLSTLLYTLDSLIFLLLLCLQSPAAHFLALAVSLLSLAVGFLSSYLIVAECHSFFLLIESPCM